MGITVVNKAGGFSVFELLLKKSWAEKRIMMGNRLNAMGQINLGWSNLGVYGWISVMREDLNEEEGNGGFFSGRRRKWGYTDAIGQINLDRSNLGKNRGIENKQGRGGVGLPFSLFLPFFFWFFIQIN